MGIFTKSKRGNWTATWHFGKSLYMSHIQSVLKLGEAGYQRNITPTSLQTVKMAAYSSFKENSKQEHRAKKRKINCYRWKGLARFYSRCYTRRVSLVSQQQEIFGPIHKKEKQSKKIIK